MNALPRRLCCHIAPCVSAFAVVIAVACHFASVNAQNAQTAVMKQSGKTAFVQGAAASGNPEIYAAAANGGNVWRYSPSRMTFDPIPRRETSFFGQAATFTIGGQLKENLGGGGFGRESTVTLTNSVGEIRSVKTDANGRYSFANVTSGANYTLSVSNGDDIYFLPEGSATVENLSANREINFVRAARLEIDVKDGDTPLAGVEIRLASSDPATPVNCPASVTNEVGRRSFCYVAIGGTYTITPFKLFYNFDPSPIVLERFTLLESPFTTINIKATPQVSPELRTWTVDGTTFGYLRIIFGGNSVRVADWGQVTRTGNDFAVTPRIERVPLTVGEPNTNTHIYDFGKRPDGNYTFTFKSPEFPAPLTHSFAISGTQPAANPIDEAGEFVRRHYFDFLSREPDTPGLDFWKREITSCNGDAQCIDRQRVNVSASFFLSQEFQTTGYYVYRLYKGGLGRAPYVSEFFNDMRKVAAGIVVDNRLSPEKIDLNKQDFAREFVTRAEFRSRHLSTNAGTYVDALFRLTGSTPTAAERDALIVDAGGSSVNSFEQLAAVLYKISDGTTAQQDGVGVELIFNTRYGREFYDREFNRAFVHMQYFGYLRRDPDAEGHQFWLDKLNRFGNFTDAEMVRSFVLAAEYRARFGQP